MYRNITLKKYRAPQDNYPKKSNSIWDILENHTETIENVFGHKTTRN